MARFSRLEVLNRMLETGLVPVLFHEDTEVVRQIVSACRAGGAQVVEISHRGAPTHQLFEDLVRHFAEVDPTIVLGVGSVIDASTAELYLGSDASFLAGPVLDPEVARLCNRRKVAYFPGCGSASEVSEAEELGVEICRLSPGSEMEGPSFVETVLATRPWSRLMPVGSVRATQESVDAWIRAGAACLGMGSDLIGEELVAAGDYQAISDRVARAISWVKRARGEPFYGPVEHVGVYPREGGSGLDTAEWYRRAFGYPVEKRPDAYFAGRGVYGRIEAMNRPPGEACHIAVRVWDFEAAMEDLKARGYELGEARIGAASKLVYLKERDPGGNLVHIIWRR